MHQAIGSSAPVFTGRSRSEAGGGSRSAIEAVEDREPPVVGERGMLGYGAREVGRHEVAIAHRKMGIFNRDPARILAHHGDGSGRRNLTRLEHPQVPTGAAVRRACAAGCRFGPGRARA